MKAARLLVVQALGAIDARAAWSNRTLDGALKKNSLTAQDRAFASALFYGVLERRITLDACLAAHCARPPEKLDPAVRNILHIGLYQMLYMDNVPDHAATNESVALAGKMRRTSAAGLINAVLRAFLRGGKAVPVPAGPKALGLSVAYSCPRELVELWLGAYGEEITIGILRQSLRRTPLYLRVNPLRTTARELIEGGLPGEEDATLPGCLAVRDQGAVHTLPEYEQGLFHVQDRSSQLCAVLLGAQPGERILDACAAPGGKSFTIAELMGDTGEIVAADLHPHRTELIRQGALRLGFGSIRAQTADMTEYYPEWGSFDRVLCDVPCSGLGTIGRRPEIKYKPLEEFAALPDLQYKILENTAQYCKGDGTLLYATCTLNPPENQAVTRRFLDAHPEFCPGELPQFNDWQQTIIPGEGVGDGFYLAKMIRR